MQISKISIKNSRFPDILRNIDDPPKSLNILGELPKGVYVGIIGTRKPTAYGEKVTYELAAADAIVEPGFHAREAVPVTTASKNEAELLKLLGTSATTSDQLIEQSGLSPAEFANIISLMEITVKVRNLGAGQWVVR
jgi:predicted Rossmann fold nucleotide-binding protein DprA/Smf involved in DNA uptake